MISFNDIIDIIQSYRGKVPRRPLKKDTIYSKDYIGTWSVRVSRIVYKQLLRHGYRGRLSGRGPIGSLSNTTPLRRATLGAIYITNLPDTWGA